MRIPPSGKWKGFYMENREKHEFEMDLSFSAPNNDRARGIILGSGKDNDIESSNKDGFDVNGEWDHQRITFRESHKGGDTVYCTAVLEYIMGNIRIHGGYSMNSGGEEVDTFSMTYCGP